MDENTPISFDATPIKFVDPSQPLSKKPHHVAVKFASQDIQNKVHVDLIAQCAVEDAMKAKKHKVTHMAAITANIERSHMESRKWVELVLGSVSAVGYGTLYDFMAELLNIKDLIWSPQVSPMFISLRFLFEPIFAW